MNEHEKKRTFQGARKGTGVLSPEVRTGPEKRDLVVDLTGINHLDLESLALILTAQQQAEQEDRRVWLAGVPLRIWKTLDDMGLGRLFSFFPVSAQMAV